MKLSRLSILAVGMLVATLSIAAPKIDTVQPHLGTIQRSFTELAQTTLAHTYYVNLSIAGELERVHLQAGDHVRKGQLVAELAQLPLIQAVQKAKAQLEVVTTSLSTAKRNLSRQIKLNQRHFTSQATLDDARAEVEQLKAQMKDAKAELAIAQYDLRNSTLYSPISGVILTRDTEGGQWLPVGTQVMSIGSMHALEVVSDVLSQDAELLKKGDSVLLLGANDDLQWKGKVKRIDPAGFTKRSSLGVEEQRVPVTIAFDNLHAVNLGVGYRLEAKFLVGQHQKQLIVPRFSVLQNSRGQFYVMKVRQKKMIQQIVKVGISTDSKVAILSGLTVKDHIVAQPTVEMETGMKV